MVNGSEWLSQVAERMRNAVSNGAAPTPEQVTVRELVQKFGYHKRGDTANSAIRNGLERNGLTTDRDFAVGYINSDIRILLDSDTFDSPETHSTSDPTHRIGSLEAANQTPVSVHPDKPLSTATTIMLLHDFSQLPVMTNERQVCGIISWKSIGARLSMGQECEFVRQCMDTAEILADSTPLFEAIATIAEHGYVLVRGADSRIKGIVTATDISFQFMQLAGPFLFVGEIEGYLRQLIHGKFTVEELSAAAGPVDGQTIGGSGDLTLGGYCRLLENPSNWEKLNLAVDRSEFVKHLDVVRQIRNDVMHFSPDGLTEEQTKDLQDMARFFENLVGTGAI